MSHAIYLLALLLTLGCLTLVDYRDKLAFWHNRRATVATIATGIIIFSIWDLSGIGFGIFYSGNSRYALPFMLVPNYPIEELFFLAVLCYTTLLLSIGVGRYQQAKATRAKLTVKDTSV